MKFIALAVSLLLSAVVGFDASAIAGSGSSVYGVMRISSSESEVIIAVPFNSADDSPINVSNLVLTANLTVDDDLYYYNGTDFDAWKLAEGAGGVKYWQSVGQVDKTQVKTSENPATATLSRGRSLIIRREKTSSPIYLIGIVPTGTASTTIAANTKALVAPPFTGTDTKTTIDLNADVTWSGVDAKDILWVPSSGSSLKQYKYKNGQWKAGFSTAAATVPAGQGFWYESKGGAPTITWAAPSPAAD